MSLYYYPMLLISDGVLIIMIITLFSFAAAEERVPVATPTGLNAQTQFCAFFVMKAAELKCPNRIVYIEYVEWNILRHFAKHTQSTPFFVGYIPTVWVSLRLRLSSASPSPSAPSPLWSSDFVYSVYVTTLLMLLIWMIMFANYNCISL